MEIGSQGEKSRQFGDVKMIEIVPISANGHPSTLVTICENYLEFQEKSIGQEKAPVLGVESWGKTKSKRHKGGFAEPYQFEREGFLAKGIYI